MDISNWKTEDFVPDRGFRKWLFSSDSLTILVWEELLAKYPHKLKEVVVAREMLVHLSLGSPTLSESEKNKMWKKIEGEIDHLKDEERIGPFVPLYAHSNIQRKERNQTKPFFESPFYRVVAILLICFGVGFLVLEMFQQEKLPKLTPIKYTEHITRPGVKSKFTLTDETRVMLNSGSELNYVEKFSANKREIFLRGEAYFEVFSDPTRPFIVHTGQISTTALGTSFGIHAYDTSKINIYLLAGEVGVSIASVQNQDLFLRKGESAHWDKGEMVKNTFDEEQLTAWTRGVILINKTPITDAIHTLEKWYGVDFEINNMPDPKMTVSGKFDSEILQNILEGLSYSARFQFEIIDSQVMVNFINS